MKNSYFDGNRAYVKCLPPVDINVGTKYHERFADNSSEFMPLDNSLSDDLHVSHMYNCAVKTHLPNDERQKYTLSTQNILRKVSKEYGRIQLVHLIPNA